jgi:hypothetical protein
MTDLNAAAHLYPARVMHRRLVAPFYRFVYRVFYLLLDIDRIDEAAASLHLFSHNRFNLLSFHDRDHGAHQPGQLRTWAEEILHQANVDLAGGRIRLLCMPRLFGYAFNPISLWYCEHADGSLRAVITEVRNTFGEKHCYLLASNGNPMPYMKPYETEKCFHVSPFFDLVGRYRFTLSEPAESLRVLIHETREGLPILDATLAAERRSLSDGNVLKQVLMLPLMTFKVVAGIHWEALKIWVRGAKFHRKPATPKLDVT